MLERIYCALGFLSMLAKELRSFSRYPLFILVFLSLLLMTACQKGTVGQPAETKEPDEGLIGDFIVDGGWNESDPNADSSLFPDDNMPWEDAGSDERVDLSDGEDGDENGREDGGGDEQNAGVGWISTNPGGGGAFCPVGAGPSGIIVVASDLSGPYISHDRGFSWRPLGPSNGITETHICGVGFDPSSADVVFVGTENGLFRSSDGGQSFSRVIDHGYVTDIAISPANHNIAYASVHSSWNIADGRVYKSTDNGLSWFETSGQLPSKLHILKFELHPGDPQQLFLVAGAGRFASGEAACFRSVDGGFTWEHIAQELGEPFDVAVHPRQPQTVYLSTFSSDSDQDGACFVSRDGGNNWDVFSSHTGWIWLDSVDPQRVRLIDVRYQFPWDDRNGVWETTDEGISWSRISKVDDWQQGWTSAYWAYGDCFNGSVKTIGEDMSDASAVFWANGQWVFASFDGGLSFAPLFTDQMASSYWRSRGLDNVIVSTAAVSPADPDTLYVGYMDLGVFVSEDGGQSWQNRNHPDYTGGWDGAGGNTTALAVDPERAGVLWASQAGSVNGDHSLLKSGDRGRSWELVGKGLPSNPMSGLTLDKDSSLNNRRLFIAVGGNIFRSNDDGANWTMVLASGGLHYTAVATGGSLVYAGGEAGLWRSLAGGDPESWEESGTDTMRGNRGDEFWKSYWAGVSSISLDTHHPDTVYVTVYGPEGGIYRSENYGESGSWEKLFSNPYMRSLIVLPGNSQHLLATSSSNMYSGGYSPDSLGVIESTDGGASWQEENEGLSWPFASFCVIVRQEPLTLLLGSSGQGVCLRRMK